MRGVCAERREKQGRDSLAIRAEIGKPLKTASSESARLDDLHCQRLMGIVLIEWQCIAISRATVNGLGVRTAGKKKRDEEKEA